MLSGMDGVEGCQTVKSNPVTQAIPIIMITAKSEESDIVLGIGADDDITKPFRPPELIARVKVVIRRTTAIDGVAEATERLVVKQGRSILRAHRWTRTSSRSSCWSSTTGGQPPVAPASSVSTDYSVVIGTVCIDQNFPCSFSTKMRTNRAVAGTSTWMHASPLDRSGIEIA